MDMIPETETFRTVVFGLQFNCVFFNQIPKDNIRFCIFDQINDL